jgi:hypothetical protein
MNKLLIRKLGVFSCAKIYAVIMLVISLIISIPYGLIIIVYALFGAGMMGGDAAFAVGGGGVVLGIGIMIGLPILYGVMGFIFGAIMALIYNVFSGIVGGVEMEVESIN